MYNMIHAFVDEQFTYFFKSWMQAKIRPYTSYIEGRMSVVFCRIWGGSQNIVLFWYAWVEHHNLSRLLLHVFMINLVEYQILARKNVKTIFSDDLIMSCESILSTLIDCFKHFIIIYFIVKWKTYFGKNHILSQDCRVTGTLYRSTH